LMIAHVVFAVPVDSHFDYIVPERLLGVVAIGVRVQAVFARKKCAGIVVGLAGHSSFENLNTIIKVLDGGPVLAPSMLAFAREFSAWNACSWGEAVSLFLPAALRKSSVSRKKMMLPAAAHSGEPMAVNGAGGAVELVFDRTLTRRWEVLLPRMRAELSAGRSVLILVPEHSYVDEVIARIAELAPSEAVVALCQMTEKEELDRWARIRGGSVRVVTGFVSAVFAPLDRPGLIVVIDEESRFFKNDQTPFYHAREAALLRGRVQGIPVLCVSSAPSAEIWREAAEKRAALTVLESPLPPVRFLDISNFKMKKGSLLSPGLRQHLEGVIKAGGRALLYVPAGKGVSFVLEELAKYMPQARAAGYDRDSAAMPEADILVATQAVFRYRGRKAFDFAAVLDIDYEFHKADHRAAQAAFALVQYLRQMARARVLLQTRSPQDLMLHAIADEGYAKFYSAELTSRQEMMFPPFGAFAALVVRSVDPELACAEAKRLYDIFINDSIEHVNVMEPQQDRSMMLRGKFRWRVTLQGENRALIVRTARDAAMKFRGRKDAILTVNIDP
jgi:primosomal protein N'